MDDTTVNCLPWAKINCQWRNTLLKNKDSSSLNWLFIKYQLSSHGTGRRMFCFANVELAEQVLEPRQTAVPEMRKPTLTRTLSDTYRQARLDFKVFPTFPQWGTSSSCAFETANRFSLLFLGRGSLRVLSCGPDRPCFILRCYYSDSFSSRNFGI